MTNGGDGAGFKIGVSSLLGLMGTLGVYYATDVNARIVRTDVRLEELSRDYHVRGQRISALESHYADLNRRVDQTTAAVEKRLDRIEGKLDILIGERQRK